LNRGDELMNAANQRLVAPQLLPKSLWKSGETLLLVAPTLARTYKAVIFQQGLEEVAKAREKKSSLIGGLSKQRTDEHFAQSFDGSVARVQLAILDPRDQLLEVSNALIEIFSGNSVCLIDAPCGAGAATFAFLATIAELRAKGVLPREPLDICMIGAELSKYAISYAQMMLDEIRPSLEEQAIFIVEQFVEWDVTDSIKNTDLIQVFSTAAAKISKRLLVVANFSGFLEREGKRKDAQPQLEELFRHASARPSVAVWVEQQTNQVLKDGGLWQHIVTTVRTAWKRFMRINSDEQSNDPILKTESNFKPVLRHPGVAKARLSVVRFDLERLG
jgi:hypothetical protein